MSHDRGQLIENATIAHSLGQAIYRGGACLESVPGLIKRCIKEGCWRRLLIQQTGQVVEHQRFEQYVVTKPLEGLGATVQLLKNLCRDDAEALRLMDAEMQKPPGNPTGANQHTKRTERGTVDIVNSSSRPSGNAKDAAIRRLRKDRPDLLERVEAGELTHHRAMIEAGFRKEPTPLEQCKRLIPKLSEEEKQELEEELASFRRKKD